MATNPTRRQTQARDQLAEALNLLASAARLDGGPRNTPGLLTELATKVAAISSVYTLDDVIARSIEKRALSLGLPASLAEMITLLDSQMSPIQMLWLDDEPFLEQVKSLEEELGEV